ncbi:MAG: caspase family protein [Acidobacteriota bacterium]|nr:caspase family protein [Acidobacteriota bacterium]
MTGLLFALLAAGNPVAEEGAYALLVGVGTYAAAELKPLPANMDLERMVRLLGPEGFGYRIHVLRDAEATEENYRQALRQLAARTGPRDSVVIYFSGHGGQTCDENRDESDGKDETLMLFDSKYGEGLRDDEFAELLTRFTSENLVVIVDACHASGSLRGTVTKAAEAVSCPDPPTNLNLPPEDGFFLERAGLNNPGRIFMAATSREDKLARVGADGSVFTRALVTELEGSDGQQLSYAQLSRRVRARLRGQQPSFHGALNRKVFTGTRMPFFAGMLISGREEDAVVAAGVPKPGWTEDAVVRILPGDAPPEAWHDPRQPGILLTVDLATPEAIYLVGNIDRVKVGDRAVLVRAGSDASGLRVRCRKQGPEALDASQHKALRKAVAAHSGLSSLVSFDDPYFSLEITGSAEAGLALRNQKGELIWVTRGSDPAGDMAWSLWLHALQQHIRELRGDHAHLEARLVPAAEETASFEQDKDGVWRLPPGALFRLQVRNTGDKVLAPRALVLSRDGSVIGLPLGERSRTLHPKMSMTFNLPLKQGNVSGSEELIVVFGTLLADETSWPDLFLTPDNPPKMRGLLPSFVLPVLPGKRGIVKAGGYWTQTLVKVKTK